MLEVSSFRSRSRFWAVTLMATMTAMLAGCGAQHVDGRLGGSAAAVAAPLPTTPKATAPPHEPSPPSECAAPSIANTSVEVAQVDAETPGLHCCTYLRTSTLGAGVNVNANANANPKASRVAFVQSGTGIYSAADGAVGAVAMHARQSDGFALLTMDKPGIRVDARSGALQFDREAYRQYTLADLVTCGRNAITWGLSRSASVSDRASLTLHGHSEGGQMMIRLLAAAPTTTATASSGSAFGSPFGSRLERTIVSGLPLEPLAVATERQVAIFMPFEIEAFHDAIAKHDDEYLLQHGLSTSYLTHPTARQSFEDVLSELAVRRPGLVVEAFHGDRDVNAPLSLMKSFATKNDNAKKAGRPAIDLRLHVYHGARHYLDRRFDADVRTLLGSAQIADRR